MKTVETIPNQEQITLLDSQQMKRVNEPDTSISIALFDMTPFEKQMSRKTKKRFIEIAINSAMPDAAYRYLELNCWKINPDTKKPYKDTSEIAPDCRLDNFHIIDLDHDGDLDLIYSSSIDQYIQSDTNYLLLIQNNNGSYKEHKISGFLYEAQFYKTNRKEIIFKTVSRPCCEDMNYKFFETTFNTKSWTFNTKNTIDIHKSQVHEE